VRQTVIPVQRRDWLQNRDRNSLPLGRADRVLSTTLTVARHQRKYVIGRVDNLLVSGMVAPRDLALAFRTGKVRPKYLGSEPTLACGLLCPDIRTRGTAGYDDGVRREAGNEAIDGVSVRPAAGADNGNVFVS